MRAIILAAGRGSRLGPYGEDRPKCLVELGGMTLIDRQIATLRSAGVGDIVIATGYRADMLEVPGTRTVHNASWETTNMVETLFCAEAELGADAIVAYGDIVFEPRVLAALLNAPGNAVVAVDRAWRGYWQARFEDPLSDAESLRLDGDGCISEIGRPVADIDEIEAQYMGLMRFRGPATAALAAARRALHDAPPAWLDGRAPENAYMTDLLMQMVAMGHRLHAAPVEGGWLEIDSEADLKRARRMFADGTIGRFYDPGAIAAAAEGDAP